jgi:hypothetical protein
VTGLRLAADAVLDLWERDRASDGDRAAARQQLLTTTSLMVDWYTGFGASLAGLASIPDPLTRDADAEGRLVEAVSHDLRREDGRASATAARMIWTGDHLDAARRLQSILVEPARAVADQRDSAKRLRAVFPWLATADNAPAR